jgi:hypothetical protein
MFPLFHITPFIEIHMFGIFLVCAWVIFFWLLHKYSTEHGISKNIFWDITSYTLSMFFWWRIFYMLSDWRNEKYLFINLVEDGWIIDFLSGFFISENYNLSLAWSIIWFLLVFWWKAFRQKVSIKKGIDILARSFFWAAIVWYVWALLWGQVYGITFDSIFSLLYTNKNSIVPIWTARFPLPIIYIVLCLIWGLMVEKIRKSIILPDGFIGYVAFWFYWVSVFLFEFLSGSTDMFESYPPYIGINQILSLGLILFSLIWILRNTKF